MTYVKVSSKYQIVIPKEIRAALRVKAGDKLYIGYEGDRIVLKPLPKVKKPTEVLYGSLESDKDAVEAVRAFRASGVKV